MVWVRLGFRAACASTLVLLAFSTIGCGVDGHAEPPEGGDRDGGDDGGNSPGNGGRGGRGSVGTSGTGGADPCDDVEGACDAATSCDGDDLVTCERNEDGCLVETSVVDCTEDADFCDDSGTSAACGSCGEAECDEANAECNGDTLIVCEQDENGCWVLQETDCSSATSDYCDADAATPVCRACAVNDCEEEGIRCDEASLVTCTEDENGCFEREAEDCTAGSNNWCLDSGNDPRCGVDDCREGDGTAKDDVCLEDETMCDGNTLIECEEDDDGCMIAKQTDCTEEDDFNACNPDTLECWDDPCIDVTNCTDEGEVTCDGANVVTCTETDDHCLVEEPFDCTIGGTMPGRTCDPELDPPECGDCHDDEGCDDGEVEGDTACSSNVHTLCDNTDADECLEAIVEDCGDDFDCDEDDGCVYSGDDDCDEELDDDHVLRAEGTFEFTTVGEASEYSSYVCPGIDTSFPFQAASPDMLFALDVPPGYAIDVAFRDVSGFNMAGGPWMLIMPSCEDGTTQAERTCTDFSFSSLNWTNETDETVRTYLVVDADDNNGGADNVGPFSLRVEMRALDCGDGNTDGDEECDDGNFADGDGCDECVVEDDFACTGIDPSICTRRPVDYECGNVACDPIAMAALNQGAGTCCTVTAGCGISYEPMYGASCLPMEDVAPSDDECDDEASAAGLALFAPTLTGCCREEDGLCGLTAVGGNGCVERTVTWAAMQDGAGSFYYDGPFVEQDCEVD
jgi:hypothetical protein